MSLFSKIRDLLVGRPSPRRATMTLAPPSVRFDDFPPFNLHIAELMRFDPQVRIGLGARNGLLMSAQVDVTGPRAEVNHFVQEQWDRLWCACAQQLLRAKLYGFQPFEVFFRRTGFQPFQGKLETCPTSGDRLKTCPSWEIAELRDRPVAQTRLLVRDDRPVGFVWKDGDVERR